MKISFSHSTVVILSAVITLLCRCDFSPMGSETLKVVSCTPGNGVRGVAENTPIVITFNNGVNRHSIEQQFELRSLSGSVSGDFSWENDTSFTFLPHSDLETGVRYVINLPRTVRDSKGNIMKMDFLSEFYTGADIDKPYIVASDPAHTEGGAPDIPVTRDIIVITFSEPMDIIKTENAFNISPFVNGYFTWNSARTEMTYHFIRRLDYGMRYTATVSASAVDDSGNSLAEGLQLIFITVDDHSFPSIVGMFPIGSIPPPYWDRDVLTTGLSKYMSICLEFSKAMDRVSSESSFSLNPPVAGTFSWNAASTVMTFTPSSPLSPETVYLATIAASAKDENGRGMATPYQLSIMTNADDSLLIRVGRVWGSHDGDITDPYGDHLLFTATPPWPVYIETGPVADPLDPQPFEKDYYFMIELLRTDGNPVTGLNLYSFFDNVQVEGYCTEGDSPFVKDILPGALPCRVIVVIGELTSSLVTTPLINRITLGGGDSGIKDSYDNTMSNDFIFEFRDN